MVSKAFVKRYANSLKEMLSCTNAIISHSKEGTEESAPAAIWNGTIQIGDYLYSSNWIIGDTHYDVILGMP